MQQMIRTDRLAGYLILYAVLCLPLLTWIPLTTGDPNQAVGQTPYWLLWCLGFLLVACWVGQQDGILGLIVGYAAVRAIPASWWGSCTIQVPHFNEPVKAFTISCGPFPAGSIEVAAMIAICAVIIVAVQSVQSEQVRLALLSSWGIQVVYIIGQWQGFDPIWRGLQLGNMRPLGTLGQENFVGVVLAMILPLVHRTLWLPCGALFYLLSSTTGAIAGAMGIARRCGLSWGWIGVLSTIGLSYLAWNPPASLFVRMIVWRSAMQDQNWWTWLVGHGWGAWVGRMADLHEKGFGVVETYMQAHNELIQMYYEGGMGFLVICGWWIWSKREAWTGMWGGAALAVLVTTFGFFTFHAAYPALVGLVIAGTAIRAKKEASD